MTEALTIDGYVEKRKAVENVLIERNVYANEGELRDIQITLLATLILSELGFQAKY